MRGGEGVNIGVTGVNGSSGGERKSRFGVALIYCINFKASARV
jgi:hypothetical protein